MSVGNRLPFFTAVFCSGHFLSPATQLGQCCADLVLDFFFGRLFLLKSCRLCAAHRLLTARRVTRRGDPLPWSLPFPIIFAGVRRGHRLILLLFSLCGQFDSIHHLQALQLVGPGFDQFLFRFFFGLLRLLCRHGFGGLVCRRRFSLRFL